MSMYAETSPVYTSSSDEIQRIRRYRRELSRQNGTTRSLAVLSLTASSMRVLNLVNIYFNHRGDDEYSRRPLFKSHVLNTSIILKHRIRSNEEHIFGDGRKQVTKIIIPLSREDLSLGGFSVFVGEKAWIERLNHYAPDMAEDARDVGILNLLDEMASLDPFLLNVMLNRAGYAVSACYFGLIPNDVERLRRFVALEINGLIRMAIPSARADDGGTIRLVNAMLTDGEDERLQMLSFAMRMSEAEFREGLFAWKGLLYYKWQHARLLEDANHFLRTLKLLRLSGPVDPETAADISRLKLHVLTNMRDLHRKIAEILSGYDQAYERMTEHNDPASFRTFLIDAPQLFTALSEAIGISSDLVTFWRFVFPDESKAVMTADVAGATLREFCENLSLVPVHA